MFKKTLALTAVAVLGLNTLAGPGNAMGDDDKAALAAAALIGIAALAHHQEHHRDGAHSTDANYEADYERGYRDGLHNEPFDANRSSEAFAIGYDAGHKERGNSLAYKTSNVGGTKVPQAALSSCVNDAASAMSVSAHHIHVIKAGQEGSDTFYIEVAAGHKHLVCSVNSQGQIFDTRYGRL